MNSGRFPDILSKYWREKKHQGRCETEIPNDKKIGRLTADLASSKIQSENDQIHPHDELETDFASVCVF